MVADLFLTAPLLPDGKKVELSGLATVETAGTANGFQLLIFWTAAFRLTAVFAARKEKNRSLKRNVSKRYINKILSWRGMNCTL